MATAVLMPTFGLTEGEATITRWLKAAGEPVTADEPLFEAETEKATIEVPAPASGVLLSILVDSGQSAKLTGLVGWVGQPGERLPASTLEQSAAAASLAGPALPPVAEGNGETWIKASPIARRLAREHGLDLATLRGSGPGGRIMEGDVRQVLNAKPTAERATASSTGPAAAAVPSERRTLSNVRLVTARRMTESFHTAPHFYLQVEVPARRLVDLREQLLLAREWAQAAPSYTALLLRALAVTLSRHPLLNAAWDDGQVRVFREIHLGVAVATPQGLVVPVIHHAETLSLRQLSQQLTALAAQARAGHLTPADLSGGTFTLTNLGMFGVDGFFPILNPPQSAILAAGTIAERPVGERGQVVLRPTVNLTLAADHRVVDGAEAALFLRDLREYLEAPAQMLSQDESQ